MADVLRQARCKYIACMLSHLNLGGVEKPRCAIGCRWLQDNNGGYKIYLYIHTPARFRKSAVPEGAQQHTRTTRAGNTRNTSRCNMPLMAMLLSAEARECVLTTAVGTAPVRVPDVDLHTGYAAVMAVNLDLNLQQLCVHTAGYL